MAGQSASTVKLPLDLRDLVAFVAGGLFGAGLLVSGMIDTRKVQGWLDFFGDWDPTLAFVLGGAVLPMIFVWRIAERRGVSLLGTPIPDRSPAKLDRALVTGSLIRAVAAVSAPSRYKRVATSLSLLNAKFRKHAMQAAMISMLASLSSSFNANLMSLTRAAAAPRAQSELRTPSSMARFLSAHAASTQVLHGRPSSGSKKVIINSAPDTATTCARASDSCIRLVRRRSTGSATRGLEYRLKLMMQWGMMPSPHRNDRVSALPQLTLANTPIADEIVASSGDVAAMRTTDFARPELVKCLSELDSMVTPCRSAHARLRQPSCGKSASNPAMEFKPLC